MVPLGIPAWDVSVPTWLLSPHLSELDGVKVMLSRITSQTGLEQGRQGQRSGDLEEFLSESKTCPEGRGWPL